MAEANVLTAEDRVELLDGHICTMSPIGSEHAACVDRLTRIFVLHSGDTVTVRVQNPVRIDQYSEPEPDLALVRPDAEGYQNRHPDPDDTLLLVEVATSSVEFDRDIKLPLYAGAGIPVVWIVALNQDHVTAYHSPADDEYTQKQRYERSENIPSEALPELDAIAVEDILGTAD